MSTSSSPNAGAALRLPEFRRLFAAVAFSTLASRAIVVVLNFQIYAITHSVLALGFVGLVEVIPSLSLALFAGHFADKHDRRRIILVTQLVSVACAIAFALVSAHVSTGVESAAASAPPEGGCVVPWLASVWPFYLIVFVVGIARGFADPALSAFEAQVVPREIYVNASVWLSSAWQACAILGPMAGGFALKHIGPSVTYSCVASFYLLALVNVFRITSKPVPDVVEGESIWSSIAHGVRFVFRSQALVGSMALDLFAVLFGGAVALLPTFASDILHVNEIGFGFLNAATSIGSLLVMLWSTMFPPIRNAGRNLFICVAGFGVSIIIFALSTNVYLSMFMLILSGAFDGVSVVIRKAIVRVVTPENMRARVSSVSWIFIASSNELGAFESGLAAWLLGTVRSVWLGGIVTLLVVGVTAVLAPKLRRLRLDASSTLIPDTEPASTLSIAATETHDRASAGPRI